MAKQAEVKEGRGGLERLAEHSPQVEALRKDRQALGDQLYADLGETEELFKNLQAGDVEKAAEMLSKLDKGFHQYGEFKQTIAELAAGLTANLEGYVNFASQSKNYTGKERIISWFAQKKANRMRLERLETQSPRENLQMVLEYAEQLVGEIVGVRQGAIETHSRLRTNTLVIGQKIKEYEPRQAELKEELDVVQRDYSALEKQVETATADQQPGLITQKEQLHDKLVTAKHEYGQAVTVYKQAQDSYRMSEVSQRSFEDMIDNLGRQATMIKEKMDNVTEVYLAAPEAIKAMMATKGMENMDKVLNAAAQQAVEMTTSAAEVVQAATHERELLPIIDEKILRDISVRVNDVPAKQVAHLGALQTSAERSQAQRYKA